MKKKFNPRIMQGGKVVMGGAPEGRKTSGPTIQEVCDAARQAVLPDVAKMIQVLGDRIGHLYTEQAKTAVILNSLAELLIMKTVVGKDELQALVTRNQKVLTEQYKRAMESRAQQEGKKDEQPSAEHAAGPVAQTVCESKGGGAPTESPK